MTSTNRIVRAGSNLLRRSRNGFKITVCRITSDYSRSSGKGGRVGDKIPCYSCTNNNKNTPAMYETRKYGHELPGIKVCPNFETLIDFPSTIFRNTDGEVMGPGAGKTNCFTYKAPEYYSYHHMSYNDVHLALRIYRVHRPDLKRKAP